MIKPMECPRCHVEPQKWTVYKTKTGRIVGFDYKCPICGVSVRARKAKNADRKWNAHCRRELRRMKREEKEK